MRRVIGGSSCAGAGDFRTKRVYLAITGNQVANSPKVSLVLC